jgi:hypothetical protein
MYHCHSRMRHLAQARNPYSRWWLWISGLVAARCPGMTASSILPANRFARRPANQFNFVVCRSPRSLLSPKNRMRAKSKSTEAQNRNGLTETSIFPSAVCSTLKSTCFCAVVSPTVTYNNPLQATVRVALLLEFMRIVSSNLYPAPCLALSPIASFSASVLALLTIAATALEFLRA